MTPDHTDSGTQPTLPVRSAFADEYEYDARRMTTSWRTTNAHAVDKSVDDHAPYCPRCDDVLAHGATYCAECGVKVTV